MAMRRCGIDLGQARFSLGCGLDDRLQAAQFLERDVAGDAVPVLGFMHRRRFAFANGPQVFLGSRWTGREQFSK